MGQNRSWWVQINFYLLKIIIYRNIDSVWLKRYALGVGKEDHPYFLPFRTRKKEMTYYQTVDPLNSIKFSLNKDSLQKIPFKHKKKKEENKGAIKKAFRKALGI